MSYIIVATVDISDEGNAGADKEAVDASILKEAGDSISFDIPGEFGRQKELTLKLVTTLINAGFCEFEIHHSY